MIEDKLKKRIANIKNVILSRPELTKIIKKYTLHMNLPLEQALRIMHGSISINTRGDVIRISYQQKKDPEKVMKVTEELGTLFILENMRHKQKIYQAYQFLEKKVREGKSRLREKEREMADYKRKHMEKLKESIESNVETRNRYIESIETRDQLITKNNSAMRVPADKFQAELDNAVERLGKLYNRKKRIKKIEEAAPSGESLLPQLQKLQTRLTQLRLEYTDAHPAIKQTREALRLLKVKIEKSGHKPKTKKQKGTEREVYVYPPEVRKQIKERLDECTKLQKLYLEYQDTRSQLQNMQAQLYGKNRVSLTKNKISSQQSKKIEQLRSKCQKMEVTIFEQVNKVLKDSPELIKTAKELYQLQLTHWILADERKYYREKMHHYQQLIENYPKWEQPLIKMQRDYDDMWKVHQELLRNRDRAKMMKELEEKGKGVEFIVLEPAYLPGVFTRFRSLLVLVAGLAAGLGLGGLLAYQRELLSPRIEDIDRLQDLASAAIFTPIPRFRLPMREMKPVLATQPSEIREVPFCFFVLGLCPLFSILTFNKRRASRVCLIAGCASVYSRRNCVNLVCNFCNCGNKLSPEGAASSIFLIRFLRLYNFPKRSTALSSSAWNLSAGTRIAELFLVIN